MIDPSIVTFVSIFSIVLAVACLASFPVFAFKKHGKSVSRKTETAFAFWGVMIIIFILAMHLGDIVLNGFSWPEGNIKLQ